MTDNTEAPIQETSRPGRSVAQILMTLWGVGGVLLVLFQAIHRLAPLAIEPIESQMMNGWHWGLYLSWAVFNGYAEGYRGFHRSFSPRVVARAFHLARHPRPVHVLLAPAYCMALFHAKRKNLIMAWVLVFAICGLVVLVRLLPQPWRGIVDVGVVVGLAIGSLSILYLYLRALWGFEEPSTDSFPE